jgi:hypothetical protein
MPIEGWVTVTNSEILIAGGSVTLNIQPMIAGQQTAPISFTTNQFVFGLASITPRSGVFLSPQHGVVGAPPAPQTTVFVVLQNGAILAASPAVGTDPAANTVITVSNNPQQNGIAVYQKAIPPNEAYFGPELPVYLYVLCSTPQSQNGETVFRYQVNSNPPYQPAGLNLSNPADPTFIAPNSVPGVPGLLTTWALVQGLACSQDGTLAVADGAGIRFFDALTGAYLGVIGVNSVSLGLGGGGTINNGVFSLSFGPDGCLYVVAGPALLTPANPPEAVAILKCAAGQVSGTYQKILVPPTTLSANNNSSVGMTVGGTSAAPIVYAVAANDEGAIIQAYDGNSYDGSLGNPFPQLLFPAGGLPPTALAIVNTYTIKETLKFEPPFEHL